MRLHLGLRLPIHVRLWLCYACCLVSGCVSVNVIAHANDEADANANAKLKVNGTDMLCGVVLCSFLFFILLVTSLL